MSEQNQMGSLLIGAVLSTIGGFFAVLFRTRVEKKQEIEYIKTGLTDELDEMCLIVSKLSETYKTTKIISNRYLADIKQNNESFIHYRQKLYLIDQAELRRSIVSLYKQLDELIIDSTSKVSTLGEVKKEGAEHDHIVAKFTQFQGEAKSLKEQLSSYKYKIYLLF